ncbi:MAG TPA: prepilin-type N-terminal cleavage/methylation domain-containing protein [Gemmatimonadales bacterium]|nr:prepilin-type N-terminal cleavage/methylation domain-containing protein [Gemmatimonadales bacterium]
MPRGLTLVEMLLALVIAGLVCLIALPAAGDLRNRFLVDQAAYEITAAHTKARLTAVVEGRVALLTIRSDSLRLDVIDGVDTLFRWSAAGPAQAGVTLAGGSRTIPFAPIGVAFSLANGSYSLSRGSRTKQVVVSRYGRVRVQ